MVLVVGLGVGGGLLLLIGVVVLAVVLLWPGSSDEPEPVVGLVPAIVPPPLNPPPVPPPAVQWPPLQPPGQFPPVQPPVDFPPAQPVNRDPVTGALASLRTGEANEMVQGARILASARVDEQRRPEVVQVLKAALADNRPFVPKVEVLQALGSWATRPDVPFLIALLDDGNLRVQEAAVVALGKQKCPEAAAALAPRLANPFQQHRVVEALRGMGSVAEEAVRGQVTSPKNDVRLHACQILKVIGTQASYPVLVKALRDPDPGVRQAARETLPAHLLPPTYGPQQTMTINVHLVDAQAWPAVEKQLMALADAPEPNCEARRSGDYQWVTLAPVNSDPETFAGKLRAHFEVGAVHPGQRLIYIDARR